MQYTKYTRNNLSISRLLLFLVVFIFKTQVFGQSLDSLRITLQAPAQSMAVTLRALEAAAPIRIFCPPQYLPANAPVLNAQNALIGSVLDDLLKGTDLGFLYYRDYAIVLAPKAIINTDFSSDYYKAVQLAQEGQGAPAPQEIDQSVPNTELTVGSANAISPNGRALVKALIKDAQNNDPIIGAAVLWPGLKGKNAATDRAGGIEQVIPVGKHQIIVQFVGYEPFEGVITVWNDGQFMLKLTPQSNTLSEVLIKAEGSDVNLNKAQIGVTKLDPKAIKKLPTLLGEADVVRSLLLSTGVTSVGEGAAGFNVRGGDTDQNLMLQGEMILFNTSHALGFFSTYNTDLVSKVELYKSIMPAEFGGRLASVLDVQMSEGNFEHWQVKSGIGIVSGRLGVEGPIKKGKTALSVGVRSSYSDWILHLFRQPELKQSSASFYDANAGITHRFNSKNSVTIAGYAAGDQFVYNQQFGFDYRTRGGQLAYKHTFNERFFSRFSIAHSQYTSTQTNYQGPQGATLKNGIAYTKVKEILRNSINAHWHWDAGIEAILYGINPGAQASYNTVSIVKAKQLAREQGLEAAIFGSAEWTPDPRLTLIGGLRANNYRLLGAKTVFIYNGIPSVEHIVDSTIYSANQTVVQYTNLEPRFSARYRFDAQQSVKAGYSRTSQFINQIFNTDTPTPSSQYQLSTRYIPPFRAHNMSIGYFRNEKNNIWETAAEVFYRNIDQLWDYRDFAQLTMNDKLETVIRTGIGRAYGFELSAKTTRPVLNGQVGYTYSRAQRKIEGISRGRWYASNFDKPHILNLVLNYQQNQRNTLTFNFTYSTGRPTTAPLTSYRLENNIIVPVYTPRNQSRIPDYHRLDIAYTIGRGYNKRKTLKSSWNFSIYNVYARRNAFSVFFTQEPDLTTRANRLSILGTIFPAITLNIETL